MGSWVDVPIHLCYRDCWGFLWWRFEPCICDDSSIFQMQLTILKHKTNKGPMKLHETLLNLDLRSGELAHMTMISLWPRIRGIGVSRGRVPQIQQKHNRQSCNTRRHGQWLRCHPNSHPVNWSSWRLSCPARQTEHGTHNQLPGSYTRKNMMDNIHMMILFQRELLRLQVSS